MRHKPTLDLPNGQIKNWQSDLLTAGCLAAGVCLKVCHHVDARDALQKLIEEKSPIITLDGQEKPLSIHEMLGAPEGGVILKRTGHSYDERVANQWGRRCGYYLLALEAGLRAAAENDSKNQVLKDLSKGLLAFAERFDEHFRTATRPHSGLSLEESLITLKDCSNFYVTYQDPILFSALYHLYRHARGKQIIDNKAAVDRLRTIVIQQVDTLTNHGDGRITQIADESTLWWGLSELAKHGQDFKLGSHEGWRGILEVCINLIRATNRNMIYPTPDDALLEATFEIHGETRTRILVVRNILQILALKNMPLGTFARYEPEISAFLRRQFNELMKKEESGVYRHIYTLGLALSVASMALKFIPDRKVAGGPKKTGGTSRNNDTTDPSSTDAKRSLVYVEYLLRGKHITSQEPIPLEKVNKQLKKYNVIFDEFTNAVTLRIGKNSKTFDITELPTHLGVTFLLACHHAGESLLPRHYDVLPGFMDGGAQKVDSDRIRQYPGRLVKNPLTEKIAPKMFQKPIYGRPTIFLSGWQFLWIRPARDAQWAKIFKPVVDDLRIPHRDAPNS